MRNQDVDLTAELLTLAGAMFMVPVIVLISAKLITGDVPGLMLKAGLWSMAFSLMIAANGVLTCWAEGQRHRCAGSQLIAEKEPALSGPNYVQAHVCQAERVSGATQTGST